MNEWEHHEPMQLNRLEADSLKSNFAEEDLSVVMVVLLDDELTVSQPKKVNSILSCSRGRPSPVS